MGVGERAFNAAIHRGDVLLLRRGICVDAAEWATKTARERVLRAAEAACRAYPDAFLVFETAGLVHDLPVPDPIIQPDGMPIVNIGRLGSSNRLDWLRVHGLPTMPPWVNRDQLRVTTIERTAIDVARIRDQQVGLAVMDAAMRRAIVGDATALTARQLLADDALIAEARLRFRAVVRGLTGYRGVARARFALANASPLSESVLESRSRLRMLIRQVPPPELGQSVVGADGRTYWVDFLWRGERIIGEADGLLKYDDDPLALRREKLRQEALERAGYRVIRWTWADLMNDAFIERIRWALRRVA